MKRLLCSESCLVHRIVLALIILTVAAAFIIPESSPFAKNPYRKEFFVQHPEVYLRSREEIYYHKLFTELFANHEEVARNTGRWSVRPAAAG